MDEPIHILIVENLLADIELIQCEARRILPNCVFERVEAQEAYLIALERFRPNLIISGYHDHAAQLRGDFDRAEQLHQKSLVIFREWLGEKSTGVIWAYQGLGETALGQGDPATARKWLTTNLRICRELGARIFTAWCLAGLGGVAALREEPELATQL